MRSRSRRKSSRSCGAMWLNSKAMPMPGRRRLATATTRQVSYPTGIAIRPTLPSSMSSAHRTRTPVVLISTKSPANRRPLPRNAMGIRCAVLNRFARLPATFGVEANPEKNPWRKPQQGDRPARLEHLYHIGPQCRARERIRLCSRSPCPRIKPQHGVRPAVLERKTTTVPPPCHGRRSLSAGIGVNSSVMRTQLGSSPGHARGGSPNGGEEAKPRRSEASRAGCRACLRARWSSRKPGACCVAYAPGRAASTLGVFWKSPLGALR